MFEPEVLFAKKESGSPTGAERVSVDRKNWVHKESTLLLSRNLLTRDRVREEIEEQRRQKFNKNSEIKQKRIEKWSKRMSNSPFAVDLVAEDERIQEENKIRVAEENEKVKRIMYQKEKAKNSIIIKALSETADLEALRREKRAILEEEQRLKALLSLEKTMANAKSDRLNAERAQRQRHKAKALHRRQLYRDSLDEVLQEEALALQQKHALSAPQTPPFQL